MWFDSIYAGKRYAFILYMMIISFLEVSDISRLKQSINASQVEETHAIIYLLPKISFRPFGFLWLRVIMYTLYPNSFRQIYLRGPIGF